MSDKDYKNTFVNIDSNVNVNSIKFNNNGVKTEYSGNDLPKSSGFHNFTSSTQPNFIRSNNFPKSSILPANFLEKMNTDSSVILDNMKDFECGHININSEGTNVNGKGGSVTNCMILTNGTTSKMGNITMTSRK